MAPIIRALDIVAIHRFWALDIVIHGTEDITTHCIVDAVCCGGKNKQLVHGDLLFPLSRALLAGRHCPLQQDAHRKCFSIGS